MGGGSGGGGAPPALNLLTLWPVRRVARLRSMRTCQVELRRICVDICRVSVTCLPKHKVKFSDFEYFSPECLNYF